MGNLERVETTSEPAPETPAEETPKADLEEASKEAKTPTLRETPEFQEALREAQSGWDRRIASLKAESVQAKSEAEEAKANYEAAKVDLQAIQSEHDESVQTLLGEDAEAKQAYLDRRTIAEARRNLTKEKAEAERKLATAQKLVKAVQMAAKANELSKEFGIPVTDLEECKTESEMEVKSLRYKIGKVEQTKPPEKTVSKKVDSGISTGRVGKLTVEEEERLSTEELAEHPEIKAWYK